MKLAYLAPFVIFWALIFGFFIDEPKPKKKTLYINQHGQCVEWVRSSGLNEWLNAHLSAEIVSISVDDSNCLIVYKPTLEK